MSSMRASNLTDTFAVSMLLYQVRRTQRVATLSESVEQTISISAAFYCCQPPPKAW
jgi:hypothetical protein